MPTLSEDAPPRAPRSNGHSPGISPQPSPGLRPTVVESNNYPDPSRASVVGSDRPATYNIRPDAHQQQPLRPQSAAPYPDDDRTYPPNAMRPKSAAPYPDDGGRGHGYPGARPPPGQGPQADRPGSSFGIVPQGPPGGRPLPASQSMGNLHPAAPHPDPRGRVASAGPPGPGAHRQPSPGPPGPHHGRPVSSAPYPNQYPGGPGGGRKPIPGQPGSMPPSGPNPRMSHQQPPHPQERYTPGPGPGLGGAGRPERLNALPQQQQRRNDGPWAPSGHPPGPGMPGPGPAAGGRVGSAPPAQMQSKPSPGPSPAPSAASVPTPKPGKGPATFEDMGIPQGKQEGDCVSRYYSILSHPRTNEVVQVVM
jgi:hypothetical protein